MACRGNRDSVMRDIKLLTTLLINSNYLLNEFWNHDSEEGEKPSRFLKGIGTGVLAWFLSPITASAVYINLKKSKNQYEQNLLAYTSDKSLTNKIDRTDIISFDLFDTLVLRDVYCPSDIFKIMEINNDLPLFHTLRIEAEREADKRARYAGRANSTIDEIYNRLKYPNIESVKNLEIQMEYDFCSCNPFMKKIFDYAIEKDKIILITSDTYHKKEVIEKILTSSGYRDYDRLLISSEIGLCKYDGSIYPYICKEIDIENNTVLHIGDNFHSDYVMAKKYGISAHHYMKMGARNNTIMRSKGKIYPSIHNGVVSNLLTCERTAPFKIGASIFGPLLWQYVNWIAQKVIEDDIDNLFFLSRDGYLVKNAYKICTGEDYPYLYLSRLTIRRALMSIKNIDPTIIITEDLEQIPFWKIASTFIPNFDPSILRGTPFEEKTPKLLNDSKREFIELIQESYGEYLQTQYDLFYQYLLDIGMIECKKIGLIDVGWNGSIQEGLQTILNSKMIPNKTFGYYVGIIDKPTNRARAHELDMKGFVFFLNRPKFGYELYERFFTAPHGTVVGYAAKQGEIIPLFNGDSRKPTNYWSYYEFERGVLSYIENIKYKTKYFDCAVDLDDILQTVERMVKQPTYEEIGAITNFNFEDAFIDYYSVRDYWPSSSLHRFFY